MTCCLASSMQYCAILWLEWISLVRVALNKSTGLKYLVAKYPVLRLESMSIINLDEACDFVNIHAMKVLPKNLRKSLLCDYY